MGQGTQFRSKVLGTGAYLPERVVTNQDFEKMLDTTHEWIVERTGIHRRHYAIPGEITSDLALKASQIALKDAQVEASEIDFIIFATVTPDQPIPNTACALQVKLGCGKIGALELNAACSGFVYAMTVADQFIRTGMYKKILVVGAELLHRYINFEDRATAVLFGDAAGAFVMGRAEENDQNLILTSHLHADGALGELLVLPAGGSKIPFNQETLDKGAQWIQMQGRELFKHAVRTMSECSSEALAATGYKLEDINWVVPHQANQRIIEATAKHLGAPMSKVISTVHEAGNASAATIPVAFDMAFRDGRIKRGDLVLLVAFGGGLTSGSLLLRF